MSNQQNNQASQVAQNDPMLHLAELLMKINKRERVVEIPTEEVDDESNR